MAWRELKPASVTTLAEILPDLRTTAARAYAAGFLALRDESGGNLPAKDGLDLGRFAKAVPHFALVAIAKPDRCIYRLAGETLQERIGFNPTGQNYYDLVPPERRARAAKAMEMAVDIPCGFRALVRQTYEDGGTRVIESLGLPLRANEPGIDGFLLFSDQALPDPTPYEAPGKRWLGADLLRRDLLDLGFGVDTAFADIARAE